MVEEADLKIKVEHAAFENADASDKSGLIAFELGDALADSVKP